MILKKVISGGQTGVDRAGLDAAMNAGIPAGGFCPRHRTAEDGAIPEIYPLQELESPEYYFRTEKNVIESDGTLILNKGELTEGTKLTYEYAVQYGKPSLIVQLDAEKVVEPASVIRWIHGQRIKVLNVAGPRESKFPDGIYSSAYSYMEKVFENMKTYQDYE
ncbi:MAG TPA: putative molybdenum carrier protein [Geobacteraceae bacterium]|nr:putative molybdenum carrier protein [Geobacteraceae bacterium]